jgi:ATP/maltotriose-dependent transcriptional regulator MalT
MGIGVFTVRYFEELCLRLKRPCLIVFDNYQDLPPDSPLHDVLPDAFSQLPQGVRVVVISRNDPPPSFVRLRAERVIGVIGWDEMTLSVEESDAILRMRMGAHLDNESLRNIRDMAGGWVAGVTLIAEALKRKGMPAEALAGHAPEEIFDFFAREVFNGLDGSVKTFMMKTACLPRMSAAMAGELTGEARAGKILADLFRRNYFISESFNPDPFYEYHPLYRRFLLQRSEEDFSPELRMNTRRSAAMILERSGQTGEAVDLLRGIGDWDGIAGIVLAHGKDMIGQGRHLSLQQWMTDIPEDVLAGNPWLLYWKGMSFLTCSPLQAGPLLEQAYRQFRRDGDPVGAILSASGAMNAIFIGMNDYAPLDEIGRAHV